MFNIIKRYKDEPKNKELELRVPLSSFTEWRDIYLKFLGDYKTTFQIEQSIVVISQLTNNRYGPQNRKEVSFVAGNKTDERHIRKSQIMKYNHNRYKCVLSEELPISEFKSYSAQLIRVRLRGSFIFRNWRVDFTFVWELEPADFKQLPEITKKMFPKNKKITADQYLSFIDSIGNPYDNFLSWELELEYIGKPEILSTQQIDEILHYINPDEQLTSAIKNIA